MKKWLKIFGVLAMVAVVLLGWGAWSNRKLRTSVEETRQQLRREGLKTELADFNLTLPSEMRQRASVLVAASTNLSDGRALTELQLMKAIGANTALRVSSSPFISSRFVPPPAIDLAEMEAFRNRYMTSPAVPSPNPTLPADFQIEQPPAVVNLWDQISEELRANPGTLDAVYQALSAGQFRFEPVSRQADFLLPYLANIKRLAQTLSARAALAIHEHRMAEAFTNLLALTQLTTRWQPEPIEISHLVRFACAQIAQAPLWEALQADGWSDEQLAALQGEWESAEFFAGLPETMALHRASLVQKCRNARVASFISDYGGWGAAVHQLAASIRSNPKNGFQQLKWFIDGYRNHVHYQNVGSYEDEKGLLLYYRDRELEVKRAVVCQTWVEMRAIPGATNVVPYQATQPSAINSLVDVRLASLGFGAEGRRLLGRAAEVETRRRLMVTAFALKRFQLQHGRNPDSLAELTPALLHSVPLDFMDGRELRYQRFEDDRFVLYSVGLDCTDNGGQTKTREQLRKQLREQRRLAGDYLPFSPYQNTDIVWPMPANEEETAFYEFSADETVVHMNEMMLREIERKYAPPRPEKNVWPLRREFE